MLSLVVLLNKHIFFFLSIQSGSSVAEISETKDFAEWILQVGDGVAGKPNDGVVDIKLPDDILIREVSDPISTIVDRTYPSFLDHLANPTIDPKYFNHRVILAPTNDMVNEINDYVMSQMPGDSMEYLSCDSISKTESVDSEILRMLGTT